MNLISLEKIKPILFNTKMVKATLNEQKKETRRIIRCKYNNTHIEWHTNKYKTQLVEIQNNIEGETYGKNIDGTTWQHILAYRELSPRYQKNDILYVRETWQYMFSESIFDEINNYIEENKDRKYIYRATDTFCLSQNVKWKPSIFMPKSAARIFLRVTAVRAEELQDMTQENALKEGVELPCHQEHNNCSAYPCVFNKSFSCKDRFIEIWEGTLNKNDRAKYCWKANPWVWVYEFEDITNQVIKQLKM